MEPRLLHELVFHELLGVHKVLMPFLWSVIIDIAIFLPFRLHHKYALQAHVVMVSGITVVSFLTASIDFFTYGMSTSYKHHLHRTLGFVLFLVIAAQMVLGFISRKMKNSDTASASKVLLLRKMHTYFGYSIILLAKYQMLSMLKPSKLPFWFNLFWNIFSFTFFIYRKVAHSRVESKPKAVVQNRNRYELKEAKYFDHDNSDGVRLIYENFIYSGEKIMQIHPAGREVIRSIKGRCIERYLYGMLPPDHLPNFSRHSHSDVSFKILEQPIGMINIK
jgi:hypothetical protein